MFCARGDDKSKWPYYWARWVDCLWQWIYGAYYTLVSLQKYSVNLIRKIICEQYNSVRGRVMRDTVCLYPIRLCNWLVYCFCFQYCLSLSSWEPLSLNWRWYFRFYEMLWVFNKFPKYRTVWSRACTFLIYYGADAISCKERWHPVQVAGAPFWTSEWDSKALAPYRQFCKNSEEKEANYFRNLIKRTGLKT